MSLILVCRPIRLFWRLNDLTQLEEWLVLRSLNQCQLSLLVGTVCVDIIIKEGLSEMIIGHLLGGLLYNPCFFTRARLVTQSCPTLCDSVDCSPPGFSVYRIFQARILEWVAISSCKGSSWLRDRTWVYCVSCMEGGFFNPEPPGKPTHFFAITLFCLDMFNKVKSWLGIQRIYLISFVEFIEHCLLSGQTKLHPKTETATQKSSLTNVSFNNKSLRSSRDDHMVREGIIWYSKNIGVTSSTFYERK